MDQYLPETMVFDLNIVEQSPYKEQFKKLLEEVELFSEEDYREYIDLHLLPLNRFLGAQRDNLIYLGGYTKEKVKKEMSWLRELALECSSKETIQYKWELDLLLDDKI